MNVIQMALVSAVLGSAMAVAECDPPEPPELPDGANAQMADMLAGQKAVKSFQTENLAYMACLEERSTAAAVAAEEGPEAGRATAQKDHASAIDAYNAAVSMEEEVAGQFNTEIREYKAANPG